MKNKEHAQSQEERDQKWTEMIEEWHQSGQSIAEWVRDREGITYSQFWHNKRRLFPEYGSEGEFLNQDTTWSAITMDIPTSTFDVFVNDCRVVVKSGFDQELFREIVEVLKR